MIKNLFIILLILPLGLLAQDLEDISALGYYQEKPSIEKALILKKLIGQFNNASVSQANMNSCWNDHEIRKKHKLMRFQIVGQKLYADSFDISHLYFVNLLQYFQKLVTKFKINDVDFIIHARDELLEEMPIPSFMMSKNISNTYEASRFLMPDAYMLSEHWAALVKQIKGVRDKYNWQTKRETIFWRGATTGSKAKYLYNINNVDKFPRLQLVILSKLYPDKIDAKFNRFPEFSDDAAGNNLKNILTILFGKKSDFVKEIDHLFYKYLIAIDGNTSPWQRVPWIMFSNSVLMKQETNNVQWFYPALKPYVHYVPLQDDLTDIFFQLEWLKQHDEQAKQISLNAQQFIENNLLPEDIDKQMVITLNEYNKMQIDKTIIPSLTFSEDIISFKSLFKLLFRRATTFLFGE